MAVTDEQKKREFDIQLHWQQHQWQQQGLSQLAIQQRAQDFEDGFVPCGDWCADCLTGEDPDGSR